MEKDQMRISGLLGKAGWAFIHVLYLGRAEGQLMLGLQWVFTLLFGKAGSRYIDTPMAPMEPAASSGQAAAPASSSRTAAPAAE